MGLLERDRTLKHRIYVTQRRGLGDKQGSHLMMRLTSHDHLISHFRYDFGLIGVWWEKCPHLSSKCCGPCLTQHAICEVVGGDIENWVVCVEVILIRALMKVTGLLEGCNPTEIQLLLIHPS